MGKSAAPKADVTNYFMSLHLSLCCGPVDELLALYSNEKPMWEGSVTGETAIEINKPELFGGIKKEGGTVGVAYFLPGGPDQVMPEHLAARLGRTSATCPGFRGVSSVFFYGQTFVPLDPWKLPQTLPSDGFLWTSNNPVIAQSVWAKARRAPKGLNPETAMIGPDANPAHMIFEAATNTDWGLGLPVGLMDVASFEDGADTLFNESFGLSMVWTEQTTLDDFISEIQDHIRGYFFIHPRTGLYTFKLVRDDYDVDSLRVITPDNATLKNFQRKMWGETINEIAVAWTNPENEQEETVIRQNLAAVLAQGGPVTDSRDYHGIRNGTLAATVCERDLREASAPLASLEALCDRNQWDLTPGEVVKVVWPEYGLDGLIMRVGPVDYGKVGQAAITVSLLEDIFSLERPVTSEAPGTEWSRPGEEPAPMAHTSVLTLPAFFASSTDIQSTVVDLVYPEVLAMILAHQTGFDTLNYELLSQQTLANGQTDFGPVGTKSTLDRITLPAPMAAAAQSVLAGEAVGNVIRGPQVGGFVLFGATDDESMEIALVDAYDGLDWTLARGVLDTVPKDWPAGTALWFVNPGVRITDDQDIRSEGESPEYKLLSRTSLGVLPAEDADIVTGTLTARPHLPLRPANVKVNGTAFGSFAGGGAANLTVTWANRNRLLEDGQVIRWATASVAPEYGQETVVSVYDQTGALVYEQGALWTETQLVLPRANFDRYSAITIQVRSRRDGFWSLQGHSIGVTGLANNPAAALPPAPPAPSLPPSPIAAPHIDAFNAVGTAVTSADGTSTPTIIVVGTADNTAATGLVLRYRKNGTADYTYTAAIALSPGVQLRYAIFPLAPLTDYVVEAAYQVGDNPLSAFRVLDPAVVTTGGFIAGDSAFLAGRPAAQVLSDFDTDVAQLARETLRNATSRATVTEAIGGLRSDTDTLIAVTDEHTVFIQDLRLVDADTGAAKAIFQVNVDGHVTGFEALNDGETGEIYFVEDVFGIVSTDGTTAKKVFTVDTVNGKVLFSADVAIDGDLMVTGTITTPKVADNNITAMLVSSASSVVSGTDAEVTVFTHNLTLEFDADVMVLAQINFMDGGGNPASYHHCATKIYIDGVIVAPNDQTGATSTSALAALGSKRCSAGAHTITLKAFCRTADMYSDRTLVTLRAYK